MTTLFSMRKAPFYFLVSLALTLSSCIGTDILDVELFDPEVRIVSQVVSLEEGTTFQFMGIYLDEFGMEASANLQWSSSDETIISIDNTGLATAQMEGTAFITVSFDGLEDELAVLVNKSETNVGDRIGEFKGLDGYEVIGDFSLDVAGTGLELNFKDNFSTVPGPGLYVYLTNSQSSVAGGAELGPLKNTVGAQTYQVPGGIELGTYDYVMIYCKPFTVPFGLGTFE